MLFSVNHGTEHMNSSTTELTLENVYNELLKNDIQEPLIVLAQVYHETGNLKSNICLTKNNLLGFNTNKGYRKFDSWQECIVYAKTWQDKRYQGGDYFMFLKKIGYATDINYIKKLKLTLNKITKLSFIL